MAVNTTNNEPPHASGYRIKVRRDEFLHLLRISNRKRVYKVKNFMYFAFDGFVIYTQDCDKDEVMGYAKVIRAIEFSNYAWQKT